MSLDSVKTTKIRVTNITKGREGGRGMFLDPGEKYGNKLIAPGHTMLFDTPNGSLPECVETWKERGFISVHDANTAELLAGPLSGEISPGILNPVRPATKSQDESHLDDNDPFGEDLMDFDSAKEAILEHTAPVDQSPHRIKVSLGRSEEEVIGGEISPIPGDRPRDLDGGTATIKAPRSHAVGAVIGKK